MTYVTVDVDLSEFDTDDLRQELRDRGFYVSGSDDEIGLTPVHELVRQIYEKRRLGQDYQPQLDQLIYNEMGRIL